MRKQVRLSKLAIIDLKNIFDYTSRKWGIEQAKKYTLLIESTFKKIDREAFCIKRLGDTFELRKLNYLEYPIEKHRVILKEKKNEYFIIRILHQSMDTKRHL